MYELAQASWQDVSVIRLFRPDGAFLCEFPLSFVRLGGLNTWGYVLEVTLLAIQPVNNPCIHDQDGRSMPENEAPEAGNFILATSTPIIFARGPEYFRKHQAAQTDDGQSSDQASSSRTRASRASSRSTQAQASFRSKVTNRDNRCLVTDTRKEGCTVAHIVPQSREDLYRRILDLPSGNYPLNTFDASFGLLLRPDLHRYWDRLEFSFFYKDNSYYIHFFHRPDPDAFKYHGKRILFERFPPTEIIPNHRLIQWHYRQCVMARFRGFAEGMDAPATSNAAIEMCKKSITLWRAQIIDDVTPVDRQNELDGPDTGMSPMPKMVC